MATDDGSFKRPTGKAVAAFLFLPQFHRLWPAFSHLKPVFIRTIAVMLEQAGLLRMNHPATMYGAPGVGNHTTRELLAEAWHTLRTLPNPDIYQYGLFFSIIATIILMIVSIIMMGFTLLSGGMAHAQLFSHPSSSPSDIVPGLNAAGQNAMFESMVTHPDLAIDLLNRVLRQGALGTGGVLQNALKDAMGVYNTGVLVIASVVVFWAILSIVVDTAKTGQIGGGRHNMIWTPIRFVFALGMMVPLGAGFSSGQFVILKLAEWGSNLGTNVWVAYASSVAGRGLLAPITAKYMTDLVQAHARIYTCANAYNAYLEADGFTQASSPDQWVQKIVTTGTNVTTALTNGTDGNLCGSITWPNPTVASAITIASSMASGISSFGWFDFGSDLQLQIFKNAVRQAQINGFMATEPFAQNIGCDITSNNFADLTACSYGTPGACGGTGFNGSKPDTLCIIDATEAFRASLQGVIDVSASTLSSQMGSQAFINEVRGAGWAGMGIWYHKISSMNTGAANAAEQAISIEQGSVGTKAWQDKAIADNSTTPGHIEKVASTLASFDQWWSEESTAVVSDTRAPTPATRAVMGAASKVEGTGWMGAAGMGGLSKFLSKLVDTKTIYDPLLILLESYQSGTYPLAMLSSIGKTLMTAALLIYAAVFTASAVGGSVPFIGGGVQALMSGPIGGVISSIAGLFFISGAFLVYFLPLLPWVRVTFSVLAWIASVFEAVVMLPLLMLSILKTEGDGLFPGRDSSVVLVLNILMRPALTVLGYVGAMLVFNGMVMYVSRTFRAALAAAPGSSGIPDLIGVLLYAAMYVGTIYVLCNATFKLVDTVPAAIMKWMGGPADSHFDDSPVEGIIMAGANAARSFDARSAAKGGKGGAPGGSATEG